jgi:hypothetical protein
MINMGYNNRNGGCGKVKAMIKEHAMLVAQAVSSSTNLAGQIR